MDDLDRAQILEEKERESALLLRKPSLKPFGYCFNCSDDVPAGMVSVRLTAGMITRENKTLKNAMGGRDG